MYRCLSSLIVLHPPWTWATWLFGEAKAVASGGGSAPRAAKRSRSDGGAPPGEVTYECTKGRNDKVGWWWLLFFYSLTFLVQKPSAVLQEAHQVNSHPQSPRQWALQPLGFRLFCHLPAMEHHGSQPTTTASSTMILSVSTPPAGWEKTKIASKGLQSKLKWNAANSDTVAEWPQNSPGIPISKHPARHDPPKALPQIHITFFSLEPAASYSPRCKRFNLETKHQIWGRLNFGAMIRLDLYQPS